MTPLRALLANEAGGGRGHVTTLAAAARALPDDLDIVAALARQTYADEVRARCSAVVEAPLLARPKGAATAIPGLRGNATWADALAAIGLADATKVRRGLAFWRETIVEHDISLLIADFAPLALWAARGLRDEGWAIRTVSLGVGYILPPQSLNRFPVPLPDITRLIHDEAETLANLNAVGAEFDLDPLPGLAALYRADLTLATSFEFLDPYLASRDPGERASPLVRASRSLAGGGNEVFVYFSTGELRDEGLVQSLERLPLPRRGFLPSAPPEVKARLQASGMEMLDRPATADEIAERSRLIVHAAPHGTVCLAALAGLPQFAVPQHTEQLWNARACEALGVLSHTLPGSADIADRITAAYGDGRMADRAREVAVTLRRDHPVDPEAVLADRLASEIAAARAALA